jgi:hypothetical protein
MPHLCWASTMTALPSDRGPAHDGRLWRWYAQTEVRIGLPGQPGLTLRTADPGTTGRWPLAESHAWVLTACNPRSVPLAEDDNLDRHEELGRQLEGYGIPLVEAHGYAAEDPQWMEPGYLVPGLSEVKARALALRWEQNAVYLWTPAAWSIIGILLPGRTDLGWSTSIA